MVGIRVGKKLRSRYSDKRVFNIENRVAGQAIEDS